MRSEAVAGEKVFDQALGFGRALEKQIMARVHGHHFARAGARAELGLAGFEPLRERTREISGEGGLFGCAGVGGQAIAFVLAGVDGEGRGANRGIIGR